MPKARFVGQHSGMTEIQTRHGRLAVGDVVEIADEAEYARFVRPRKTGRVAPRVPARFSRDEVIAALEARGTAVHDDWTLAQLVARLDAVDPVQLTAQEFEPVDERGPVLIPHDFDAVDPGQKLEILEITGAPDPEPVEPGDTMNADMPADAGGEEE